MSRRLFLISLACAALACAQGAPDLAGGRGGSGRGMVANPSASRFKVYPAAAIAQGLAAWTSSCASCHGATARGGTAPDLIRSSVTMHDTDGEQIGASLRAAAHQAALKTIPPAGQVYNIAAWIHSRVIESSGRGQVHVDQVLVGDAKAGEAYFNGAGRCHTCHSVTGDLKGIGGRFDAPSLQERIVMPPRTAGKGIPANSIHATVTPANGAPVSGVLVRLTDFDVVIRLADGAMQSWTLNHGSPKVVTVDPLQAHYDIMAGLKDTDMHNVTAYLAGVK